MVNGILSTTNLVLPRDQRRFVSVGPICRASPKVFTFCRDLRALLGASSHLLTGIFFCGRSGCMPDAAAEAAWALEGIAPRTGHLHIDGIVRLEIGASSIRTTWTRVIHRRPDAGFDIGFEHIYLSPRVQFCVGKIGKRSGSCWEFCYSCRASK